MENLNILIFSEDRTSVSVLLNNGEYSKEFVYIELALIYLNKFFIENKYSPEGQKIIFDVLFATGDLQKLCDEELTCMLLIYTFKSGVTVKLDKHHLRNGLFLVPVVGSLKYQFIGIKNETERVNLSPEFLYRDELYNFLNFLYEGGLISEEAEKNFMEYIDTLTIFSDDFGGQELPDWMDIGSFVPLFSS
jgi:hypothetical protein